MKETLAAIFAVIVIGTIGTLITYAVYKRHDEDKAMRTRVAECEQYVPKVDNHSFAIRHIWLYRTGQMHRGDLTPQQFRDSVALDLDAYFIDNLIFN